MSALSTRRPEEAVSRRDVIADEIRGIEEIETESMRAKRLAKLKAEASEIEVARAKAQFAADAKVAETRAAYEAVKAAYLEAILAFLSHVDALNEASDAFDTARREAARVGVQVPWVEDVATSATRQGPEARALRVMLARCRRAGIRVSA
jgi:hypothetical protein